MATSIIVNLYFPLLIIGSVIYCTTLIYLCDWELSVEEPLQEHELQKNMKYILQWVHENSWPIYFLGEGNSKFIKNNCTYTNCYITNKTSFLNFKLSDFDAIILNEVNIDRIEPAQWLQNRSPRQKYIFAAMESAERYPVCDKGFDNFFNWTYTFKLSSDFTYGYLIIYDTHDKVIGPAIDMKWPEYMKPIDDNVIMKLVTKKKAAAWFVSHCKTISKREDLVFQLNNELNNYGWSIDIYGACSELKCPKSNRPECFKKIEEEYFFYLSFENSFDTDYVTEKLITALNNYAVPVVYGAANYSRFLPPGSYLNAMELGPRNLARVMNELITNKNKYYDFFRWRNYFTYKLTLGPSVCKLCEALNNEEMVNTVTVWKDFRKWWNSPRHAKRCA